MGGKLTTHSVQPHFSVFSCISCWKYQDEVKSPCAYLLNPGLVVSAGGGAPGELDLDLVLLLPPLDKTKVVLIVVQSPSRVRLFATP